MVLRLKVVEHSGPFVRVFLAELLYTNEGDKLQVYNIWRDFLARWLITINLNYLQNPSNIGIRCFTRFICIMWSNC
jgi:hypothetical protein